MVTAMAAMTATTTITSIRVTPGVDGLLRSTGQASIHLGGVHDAKGRLAAALRRSSRRVDGRQRVERVVPEVEMIVGAMPHEGPGEVVFVTPVAVVAQALQPAPTARPPQEQSLVEPFREPVQRWLEQGVEGQAIWQLLVEQHGFTGSYSSLKRFLHRLAPSEPVAMRR
jgi:hypothetical protein